MIKVTEDYYLEPSMSRYQILERKDVIKYDPPVPKGGIPKGKEGMYKEVSRESVISPIGYYPHSLLSGVKAILRFELAKNKDTVSLEYAVNRLEELLEGVK